MKLVFTTLLLLYTTISAFADDDGKVFTVAEDSTIIFHSPNPLISSNSNNELDPDSWGLDIIINQSGFAAGVSRNFQPMEDLTFGLEFHISQGKNSDEFDQFNYFFNQYLVPGKINRVYYAPLMAKVQIDFLTNRIFDSFEPNFMFGAGPSIIMSMPYLIYDSELEIDVPIDFFKAFEFADYHIRWGGFAGIGSKFNTSQTGQVEISVRYYYIPFGGEGIESIKGNPIMDFGGIYLNLTLLWR